MQSSFIHALGSGGRGQGAGALGAPEGTHLHDHPRPCGPNSQGSTSWGLPFSAVANRSGMVSMTPRQFLPPLLPCGRYLVWSCSRTRTPPSPSLSGPHSLSLSLPRTPSQDSCSRILHARARKRCRHTQPRTPPARGHTRTHARRHARTPPPPPAALHKQLLGAVSLLALNYSCRPGGPSRWGDRRRYFLSIPNLTKHKMMLPEILLPLLPPIISQVLPIRSTCIEVLNQNTSAWLKIEPCIFQG